MYIYIGVLILLFLLAVSDIEKIPASAKLLISLTVIFLLMALKAPVLGDYSRYADNFILSSYRTIGEMAVKKGEIGFHILTKGITYVTDNPSVYLAITSALICLFLGIFIHRNAVSKIYAVYFYYTIGLFAFSMAGLRQVLAMSICLFAYEAIRKKRLILFLLIVGTAFLFHKTAVFFLLAYPIARFQWKRSHLLAGMASLSVVIIFYQRFYTYIAKLLGYESYGIASSGNGEIFTFILLAIGVLGFIYKDPLLRQDSSNLMLLNLHFATILFWLLRFSSGMVERPSFYYLYATPILLDRIFSLELEGDSRMRMQKLVFVLALVLFGALFIYRLRRDINLLPYIMI